MTDVDHDISAIKFIVVSLLLIRMSLFGLFIVLLLTSPSTSSLRWIHDIYFAINCLLL